MKKVTHRVSARNRNFESFAPGASPCNGSSLLGGDWCGHWCWPNCLHLMRRSLHRTSQDGCWCFAVFRRSGYIQCKAKAAKDSIRTHPGAVGSWLFLGEIPWAPTGLPNKAVQNGLSFAHRLGHGLGVWRSAGTVQFASVLCLRMQRPHASHIKKHNGKASSMAWLRWLMLWFIQCQVRKNSFKSDCKTTCSKRIDTKMKASLSWNLFEHRSQLARKLSRNKHIQLIVSKPLGWRTSNM